MDNKGFISIEYLFYLFIILIIATGLVVYSFTAIDSADNIESSFKYRIILDNVANQISQVNSNGEGYSKTIALQKEEYPYTIIVEKNKLTIEYGNRKGEVLTQFINIASNYKMYSGHSYNVVKTNDGVLIK